MANKAPSQDRVTGASAQAAVHLPQQNNPQGLFISAASACLSSFERYTRRSPLAVVRPCSSSINCGIVPLTYKEVFNHTQKTPVSGHVGLRGTLPQPRKVRVA
ncbi:hypothetical protein N9H39_01305 [Gammaproteobacteria bacterium]|nr:hypothetical protein [Gammaproteobacteria bacterium]